jgi:hypothetical protein
VRLIRAPESRLLHLAPSSPATDFAFQSKFRVFSVMSATSDQPDAAQQPPAKIKGPWANRVVTSEVEHTPEYDAFMEELAEYHKKRGCVFPHSFLGAVWCRCRARHGRPLFSLSSGSEIVVVVCADADEFPPARRSLTNRNSSANSWIFISSTPL